MSTVQEQQATFDLPSCRAWAARSSSFPTVLGGKDLLLANLRDGLRSIGEGADGEALLTWNAKETTVESFSRSLGSSGLVESPTKALYRLTDDARRWLNTGDHRYLVATMHANIRFVGELMAEIDDAGNSVGKLLERANRVWDLSWTTKDQISRRVALLRAVGFVEQDFRQTLHITDLGMTVLSQLDLADPSQLLRDRHDEDIDLRPAHPVVEERLHEVQQETLRARRPNLGYIPGRERDGIETLRRLVDALAPRRPRREFAAAIATDFSISSSSIDAVLQTLRNASLAVPVSAEDYAPTSEASAWLESGDPLDLMRLLHLRLRYVGELLVELESAEQLPELARIGQERFGLRANVAEVRRRMHLLVEAGLASKVGWNRYRTTALGRAFVDSLPLEEPGEAVVEPAAFQEIRPSDDVVQRLASASRDSNHPGHFEQVIAEAFRYLGFKAEWMGQPGSTDVLVTATIGPQETLTAVVDAKTAANGLVDEKRIQFDTLVEHKRKHGAEHVAVVGAEFERRLPQRAARNEVALITTAQLTDVLRRQDHAPLTPAEMAPLLSADASAMDDLERAWARRRRQSEVLTVVLAQLAHEMDVADPVNKGALATETLYTLVRDELDPRPELSELKDVLSLLSSPLIGVLIQRGDKFALTTSPSVAARLLEAMAAAAGAADALS